MQRNTPIFSAPLPFFAPSARARSGRRWPAGIARWLVVGLSAVSLLGALPAAQAAVPATLPPPSQIGLQALPRSPQPVGTRITWYVSAHDSVPLVYRFSIGSTAIGPFQVVRDFSPHNTLLWAPLQEGIYYIQVTLKEGYSGSATVSRVAAYVVTSRVRGLSAVVSRTANPLVALYSAPACLAGRMVVYFQALGSTMGQSTSSQACQVGLSRNFLVAGMLPSTTYQMVHVVTNGTSVITSTPLYFTTGSLPRALTFPAFGVVQPPGSQSDTSMGLLYHEMAGASPGTVNPLATDLQGHVAWYAYEADLRHVTAARIQQVGSVWGDLVFVEGGDGAQSDDNVLRAIDLAGNPLQETNVQAVNAQLTALGQRTIYGFNAHDALILPDGDTAVLGFTEQTITTTPILSDMLIVLDRNWQVAWTWDAFAHLDPNRGPTLGDTCGQSYVPCPVPGGPGVIDWTHTNAIDASADGNLILSLRDQDWVIKINYANGSGDGSVLWRLGQDGDFSLVPLNSSDPYPWFSHQHDANYLDGSTLELLDNGNTRCAVLPPPCNSRGQVYTIDEQAKVVTQTVNADLGAYSLAVGTAQRLTNGNFNFTLGILSFPPPVHGQELEVLPDGTKEYVQQMNSQEYRSWRLASMDGSTNPPCPACPAAPATP